MLAFGEDSCMDVPHKRFTATLDSRRPVRKMKQGDDISMIVDHLHQRRDPPFR